MQAVTIAAIGGETPNTPLLPGSSGEVILKVDNPNPANTSVHLVSVVAHGTISVSGGNGCTLANSGVTFADQTSLSDVGGQRLPQNSAMMSRLAGGGARW